jgi:hypothetical protein
VVTLADIKKDLPAWPDNVIEQWLVHLANREDTGWPPPDPLGQHSWTYILGHRALLWWREITWETKKMDCSLLKLAKGTQKIVNDVLADVYGPTPDPNTKGRFNEAFHYILNNSKFEQPLIVMELPGDGLSVTDGNHRISAFCALQKMPPEQFEKRGLKKPAQEQEVWLGSHPRGEVPLD